MTVLLVVCAVFLFVLFLASAYCLGWLHGFRKSDEIRMKVAREVFRNDQAPTDEYRYGVDRSDA